MHRSAVRQRSVKWVALTIGIGLYIAISAVCAVFDAKEYVRASVLVAIVVSTLIYVFDQYRRARWFWVTVAVVLLFHATLTVPYVDNIDRLSSAAFMPLAFVDGIVWVVVVAVIGEMIKDKTRARKVRTRNRERET